MKTVRKITAIFLSAVLLIGLCGCKKNPPATDTDTEEMYVVGLWITYSELERMLSSDFKSEFENVLTRCETVGVTDLFVHVRAFGETLYPSTQFPMLEAAKNCDFDVLKTAIDAAHGHGIRFHAWINPYRIRSSGTDIALLPSASPVRRWLEDDIAENDTNICFTEGIYLNPASHEVRGLITDEVREILSKYPVDGIHFDDYFYPTREPGFDEKSYSEYCGGCAEPLSLADWRRENVNALVSSVYTAVKFQDKSVIFSISPAADLAANTENRYADVAAWIGNGCVDWLIPQLYFGYEYPDERFRFDRLLSQWQTVTENTDTSLMIGLAAYKMNEPKAVDYDEWHTDTDLLSKQARDCRSSAAVGGHVFFSYTALFSEEEPNRSALSALTES